MNQTAPTKALVESGPAAGKTIALEFFVIPIEATDATYGVGNYMGLILLGELASLELLARGIANKVNCVGVLGRGCCLFKVTDMGTALTALAEVAASLDFFQLCVTSWLDADEGIFRRHSGPPKYPTFLDTHDALQWLEQAARETRSYLARVRDLSRLAQTIPKDEMNARELAFFGPRAFGMDSQGGEP